MNIRPAEFKEVEYFSPPKLPFYFDYIVLPVPNPDYGDCQLCGHDVLLFRQYLNKSTCYECYAKDRVLSDPAVIALIRQVENRHE